MSSYIPLIKTTSWIDLSPDHEKLRKDLQDTLRSSCVENGQEAPIMLQGAFGIGKTTSLYYAFHYAWSVLEVPAFFVSLDDITKLVKEEIGNSHLDKIPNDRLGPLIQESIDKKLKLLSKEDWTNLPELYFPEFTGGNLKDYLINFKKVQVEDMSESYEEIFKSEFSIDTIRRVVEKGRRPLLLIDEFESKFYDLKKYIATSGGGVLRDLFDQVVQRQNMFYMIIGNGPASGYELARERGDENADSETAANRRLRTNAIPFPTPRLLEKTFLKKNEKGYINFIWWLSRCRPGHISKVYHALGDFKALQDLSFSNIIAKSIFSEPIDEGGEAVTYLKTRFFDSIDGKVENRILKKALISFEPQAFNIKDINKELRDSLDYFFCRSEDGVPIEDKLLPALKKDIFSNDLKEKQDTGSYDSIEYIKHIQSYFSYILDGISSKDGKIAFGMIGDSKAEETFSNIFLIPLLELTYDFISQYQDDSVLHVKETLGYLLELINKLKKAIESDSSGIEDVFPCTFDLFEKVKIRKFENLNLQLSLYAIREAIEQPIGSPKLRYKNEDIDNIEIPFDKSCPLICHKMDDLDVYIIPKLSEDALTEYLDLLQNEIYVGEYDSFLKDARKRNLFLYLEDNEQIEAFKNSILNLNEAGIPVEYLFELKKMDIQSLDSYQLNFDGQINDFIDSVSKIALIASSRGDMPTDPVLYLEDIIDKIGKRPWTEKKEIIRTIEHYRKLIFDGASSAFALIDQDSLGNYNSSLENKLGSLDDFRQDFEEDHEGLHGIIESEEGNTYTKDLLSLYFLQNPSDTITNLQKLISLCSKTYSFKTSAENKDLEYFEWVDFTLADKILTKANDSNELIRGYMDNFDSETTLIRKLKSFSTSLVGCSVDPNDYSEISSLYRFVKNDNLKSIARSYSSKIFDGSLSRHQNLMKAYLNRSFLEHFRPTKYNSFSFESFDKDFDELYDSIIHKSDELRDKIQRETKELLNLIDSSDVKFSRHNENLKEVKKGLLLIKQLKTNSDQSAVLMICFSVLQRLERVLEEANKFSSDLLDLVNRLKRYVDFFDSQQSEVDELYEEKLTRTLLESKFPKDKVGTDYLKRKFIKDLKKKDEYKVIIEPRQKGWYTYDAFNYGKLYKNRIEDFYKCLHTLSNNLVFKIGDDYEAKDEVSQLVSVNLSILAQINNIFNTK